jgi:predicted nucleic acid-binding protein
MIVIADSGPLHYLIWIGKIDVLPQLYPNVVAPPSVFAELTRANAPELVRTWIEHPPDWLQVRAPQRVPDEDLLGARLGPGERDAILLAQELRADELILDDRRGRKGSGATASACHRHAGRLAGGSKRTFAGSEGRACPATPNQFLYFRGDYPKTPGRPDGVKRWNQKIERKKRTIR